VNEGAENGLDAGEKIFTKTFNTFAPTKSNSSTVMAGVILPNWS
jgi:hypothetical protein